MSVAEAHEINFYENVVREVKREARHRAGPEDLFGYELAVHVKMRFERAGSPRPERRRAFIAPLLLSSARLRRLLELVEGAVESLPEGELRCRHCEGSPQGLCFRHQTLHVDLPRTRMGLFSNHESELIAFTGTLGGFIVHARWGQGGWRLWATRRAAVVQRPSGVKFTAWSNSAAGRASSYAKVMGVLAEVLRFLLSPHGVGDVVYVRDLA